MKYIIVFLTIWSQISCTGNIGPGEEPNARAPENWVVMSKEQLSVAGITSSKLNTQFLSGAIRVSGKIDVPLQNLVSVSVPLGGNLKPNRLVPGMKVNKGQAMAEVEDQQYIQLQQDFLTTRVQLDLAEKNFLRQKDLNESKASSDKVVEQRASDYQSLKIQLSALSEKSES